MSLGLILVIILVIILLGGLSGRFRGYGYGYGHRGIGIVGTILIVLLVLLLMHRILLARGLHQKVDGKRTYAETARHIPCAIARSKDAADDNPREWREASGSRRVIRRVHRSACPGRLFATRL